MLISPATNDLHVAAPTKRSRNNMLRLIQLDRRECILDEYVLVISIELHLLLHQIPVVDCTRFDNHDITPLPVAFTYTYKLYKLSNPSDVIK